MASLDRRVSQFPSFNMFFLKYSVCCLIMCFNFNYIVGERVKRAALQPMPPINANNPNDMGNLNNPQSVNKFGQQNNLQNQQQGGFRQGAHRQKVGLNPDHQGLGGGQQGLNPGFADGQGLNAPYQGGGGGVGGQGAQQPIKKHPKNIMIADHPDCQEDVIRLCSQKQRNNFAVLDCLQGDLELQSQITEQCQHLIWMYKRNLTRDDRFESAGKEVCHSALMQFPECKQLAEGSGQRIPCLLEHMDNISDPNCHQFLNKMGNIIFSDYRLVYGFMDQCSDDINTFSCGRLDTDQEKMHAQGQTIICLAGKIQKLKPECKKQVLRVAELQSDDYHLDRPLYYACRSAREDFCEAVHAGGGQVFKCLYKYKNDPKMPVECNRMLTLRQQLMDQDVKVDETFYLACKHDIQELHCLKGPTTDVYATRSIVLLCLENALKRDHKLNGACVGEMQQVRRSLMEDYQISPEIVTRCAPEITKYCEGGVERGGKTLHCLMARANEFNDREHQKFKKLPGLQEDDFSSVCKAALEELLKEADVAEDITIDRVLAEACEDVLINDCKVLPKDSPNVINCLMSKLDSDHMTDECEDRLLEIQYFIVRDFKLDSELYRSCAREAAELCSATEDWNDVNKDTVEAGPMVFPCLYRHMKEDREKNNDKFSDKCSHQVRRAMRKRAKRIDLNPEIEDACITDLGAHCSDLEHYGKGREFGCLQDNMDVLLDDCRDAIKEFTIDQDEDLDLDTILMKACTPMIKQFCGELLEKDSQASDVMDCLIEHKNHHDMDVKCSAGVEHHQLIQLKDFNFSHKFKEACKGDVLQHCKDKTKKSEIVVCLSETVRQNVLLEEKHAIKPECRQQLRVEVLRRGESINLDPVLQEACETDIKEKCKEKHAGNAQVIECLRMHQKTLHEDCHKHIFKREKDEAVQGADYQLFRDCKSMIKFYCKGKEAGDVLDCLKFHKNEPAFDAKCRMVVMRRVLQETKDYRLNPSLSKSCKLDIPKFCKDIVDQEQNDVELEGKVVNCLKMEFIKKKLSKNCHLEIQNLIKETHMDINMDPVLMHACEKQIKQYCSRELSDIESQGNRLEFQPESTGDKIEECLETKLMEGKIEQTSECGREISRMVEEAHVDVNVDPQLHTACMIDLTRWCQDVDSGEGRKMSCLLTVLEDYPDKMKVKCSSLLVQRKSLWEYAAKPAPAESLGELSDQIMQSNSKTYLLAVLMTIVGVIFIVGITCGRVTKRVTAANKNK